MTTASERCTPHTAHQDATDPRGLIDAAMLIEAGATVEDAYDTLSAQDKTTLFRVENRPPLPLLANHENPAALLRERAAKLKDDQ